VFVVFLFIGFQQQQKKMGRICRIFFLLAY
jgi:hypothetical protein